MHYYFINNYLEFDLMIKKEKRRELSGLLTGDVGKKRQIVWISCKRRQGFIYLFIYLFCWNKIFNLIFIRDLDISPESPIFRIGALSVYVLGGIA
jgi:hypothetical protein